MTTALLKLTGHKRYPRQRATSMLGMFLDQHMDKHGISQTKLAATLDCSGACLSRIRSGERTLGGHYDRWASVLGLPVGTVILAAHGIDVVEFVQEITGEAV